MNKIFTGVVLSILLLPTVFAQGIECYGNKMNVVRLVQNSGLQHDFSVNGRLVATNLNCMFKGSAANCQSPNYNLEVTYSDTFRLDPATMTLLSSTTALAFNLHSLEDVTSYNYDFTKPGTNCVLL